MSTTPDMAEEQAIVATAGSYYRKARYILVAIILGAGLWFLYDGTVAWPHEQEVFNRASEADKALMKKPHTDLDIRLQRTLAGVLIPLAPVLLILFLHRSRGAYRLTADTLSVPGHPEIPIENLRLLDKSKWDRKGIAYVEYEVPGSGTTATLKLDDFIYERDPTDRIVEWIEAYLAPEVEQPAAEAAGEAAGS